MALWRPPPPRTLSEWADEHFYMSAEDGGKWRTLPYQRGIMDALTDPEVERVSVMKSARVGYTKILIAFVLYHMKHDPASLILAQPTVEDAEGFSKGEIAPAIARHDFLRGVVSEAKSKVGGVNTILAKEYFGRTLWMIGANSGRGFRRIHARAGLGDEVDAWPPSAGADGDQVELLWRRTQEAKIGRKLVLGSTPLDKGASRIEASYKESDQRRYHVPCPHCDHGQALRFGGKDDDFGIKWDAGKPETAYYLCENCHAAIEEVEKPRMLAAGDWIAAEPFKGHAGFHLWAAYSLSPNATWGHLASEWVRLHGDPVTLKTFVNTWLGETWEQKGRSPKPDRLMDRRETLPASSTGETLVPRDAVTLTSMTDVQLDRLEVGIEAWGIGEENWKIEYHVLHGDPTAEPVWQQLWELLQRPRVSERGIPLYVRSSCVDSGYASQSVYAFVRERPQYRLPDGRLGFLFATKGVTGTGNVWPARASTNTISKCPIYTVKVDAAKDVIAARLDIDEPGPGYVHFPTFFGEDYFHQLTAEHSTDARDKRGFPVRTWRLKEGHKRNEPWDIAVGNYAALCALVTAGASLEDEAKWLAARTEPVPVEARREQVAAESRRTREESSGWLGETRGWI